MLSWRAESGSDQEGPELVAVKRDGVGFVVHPRPPDVRSRGMVQEFFFDGIANALPAAPPDPPVTRLTWPAVPVGPGRRANFPPSRRPGILLTARS
jgi:hypothetical protein